MARVTHVERSRNDLVCGQCREAIPKGSPYQHASPGFRAPKKVRCLKPQCRFRPSDLTTSLMSEVYAAQEVAEDNLDGWSPEDGIEDLQGWLNDCAEAAREVAGQYEEAAEAMGDAGESSQERADAIEEWASDLESVDFDDPDEDDDEVPECTHCDEEIGKDEVGAWFHTVTCLGACDPDDVASTVAEPAPEWAKEAAQRKTDGLEDWAEGCRDAYTGALNGLSI